MKCIKLYDEQHESDLFQADLVFSYIARRLWIQDGFESVAKLRQTCKKADKIMEKYTEWMNEIFHREIKLSPTQDVILMGKKLLIILLF